MGQWCLYYFVVTLDQKAMATNHNNDPFEKLIAKNWWRHFWTYYLWKFYATRRRRKPMTYLEFRRNSEQETCACYVKIMVWKLDFIWPDLVLIVKGQVGWDHRVKWLWPSISACRMIQETCVARYVCDLFIVTFCDLTLTLTFFKYALRAYAVSFVDYIQHYGWVWHLCSPSNRPESQKGENVSLWPLTWPWHDTWPWS